MHYGTLLLKLFVAIIPRMRTGSVFFSKYYERDSHPAIAAGASDFMGRQHEEHQEVK